VGGGLHYNRNRLETRRRCCGRLLLFGGGGLVFFVLSREDKRKRGTPSVTQKRHRYGLAISSAILVVALGIMLIRLVAKQNAAAASATPSQTTAPSQSATSQSSGNNSPAGSTNQNGNGNTAATGNGNSVGNTYNINKDDSSKKTPARIDKSKGGEQNKGGDCSVNGGDHNTVNCTVTPPPKSPSTEPADRANIYVVKEEFQANVPTEQAIAEVEAKGPKFADALGVMWLLRGTKPRAIITMRNVGRNRVLPPYMVHTAIILSPPLFPNQEDELFKDRSEWTGGSVSLGNSWYPSHDQDVYAHFDPMLSTVEDWRAISRGEKVFYVVTKSTYCDKDGTLPEAVSCYWFSLSGSHDRNNCFTHNN